MQHNCLNTALINTDKIISGLYDNYYINLKNKEVFSSYSFEERTYACYEMVTKLKKHEMYFYRRTNEDFIKQTDGSEINNSFNSPVNLASNDYLGFTKHPVVVNAGIEAMKEFGSGSGSVPMLAGTTSLHKNLENKLASFIGYESLLTFNSCYAANHGLLTALLTKADVAILDIAVHASIIDGCCNTNKIFFKHNDPDSLKVALMKASLYKNKLIIIDGVYSMEGDIAFVDGIMQLAKEEDAWLMIDESHAIGVIGENGKGTQNYYKLKPEAQIVTGSLGKAMGGLGGYAAGSKELMSFLEIACRPYIFSTSLPQNITAQLMKAICLLETEPSIRKKLWYNILYFKKHIELMGFEPNESASAIIPLIIRDEVKLLNFCSYLHNKGVFVNPIFYPVVSKKKSRIRISITALLNKDELDYALDKIETAAHRLHIT